jgi:branched-chain amino acid transport system permease protein
VTSSAATSPAFRRLSLQRVILIAAGVIFAVIVVADNGRAESLLLGLGGGALVAAIALGVVLTYRGSGVINFATGAMAMYVGYVFAELRSNGELFLPPLLIHVGNPWPTTTALPTALVLSACLGLLCHLLIFRPLRHAPPLAKVVASVGLLLVIQALIVLKVGSAPISAPSLFASGSFALPHGLIIPKGQLWLAVIVVLLAAGCWALFRFSRFGLTTRAAAENEKAALLLGYSPDLLAAANWTLSGLIVGLLGILSCSVNQSVDPTTITLLIVPALGAALIGAFTSFGITVAAGLAIGMLQSLTLFVSTKSWFPHAGGTPLPGVDQALPFLVIIIGLAFRGQAIPTRGTLTTMRLPFAPKPQHVALKIMGCTILALAGLFLLGPDWRLAEINTLVGIVICLSFVVLTGFVGQISLAQGALAGIAGFALAKFASSYGLPFPLAPVLGVLAATLFGVLVAIPALRVRGVSLAVLTLAMAVAVENFVFRNPSWSGGLGGALVPSPHMFGLQFGPNDPSRLSDGKLPNPWFGVFCLLCVVASSVAVVKLRRSATGRRMLAVRANERAAAAAGISVAKTKILAFAISACIAGIGGVLSGYRFGSVSPTYFGSLASMSFLAFAYLGGVASVTGAVLGGFFVTGGVMAIALQKWFGVPNDYILLIGGLGLIVTAIFNPEGVSGALRVSFQRLATRARPVRRDEGEKRGGHPTSDAPVEGAAN